MKIILTYFILVSFAAQGLCFAAGEEDVRGINPEEIRETGFAKALQWCGFLEDSEDSGVYRKEGASLTTFMKTFDLSADQLRMETGVSIYADQFEWQRHTDIDNNPVVLYSSVLGKTVELALSGIADDVPVDITIDLGRNRPKNLWVGMSMFLAESALEHIGGKRISYSTVELEGDVTFLLPINLIPDLPGTNLRLNPSTASSLATTQEFPAGRRFSEPNIHPVWRSIQAHRQCRVVSSSPSLCPLT